MTLQLAVKITADASSLQSGARDATAALNPLQTAIGALDAKATMLAKHVGETAVSLSSQTAELGRSAAAHRDNATAAALNRGQIQEVSHVLRELITMSAQGVDPLRALTMEGGRIATIFSMGNAGVGGTLRAVGSGILALVNPGVAMGAALAGGAALALAGYVRLENQLDRLNLSLNGLGRASGVSLSGLNSVAERGAAAAGISQSQGRDLAATLTSAGLPSELAEKLIGSARQYSISTGEDLKSAGADLAKIFADPARNLDALEEKIGKLDDRTRQLIRTQQASGDIVGAQNTAFGIYSQRIADATDRTWTFAKAWDAVKNAADAGLAAAGHALDSKTTGERLQDALGRTVRATDFSDATSSRATARQAFIDRLSGAKSGDNVSPVELARTDAESIQRISDLEDRRAIGKGRDAQADALSVQGGDIIRSRYSYLTQQGDLASQVKVLEQIKGNADAMKALGDIAGKVDPALDAARTQLANLATGAEKINQESGFATAALQAQSAELRTAAEADRAYTQALRETGDRTQAAAAALATWNQAIAQSNKEAADAARNAGQNLTLSRLTPGMQDIQRIRFGDEEARRNAVTSPPSAVALSGGASGGGQVSSSQLSMMNLLIAQGYSPAAAAGFVGGIVGESGAGLSTTVVNSIGATGMGQWLGARKSALLAQPDPYSLDTQSRFVVSELAGSERPAAAKLSGATDVAGGLAANLAYERPSKDEIASSYATRLSAGNALYGAYLAQNASAGAPPSGSSKDAYGPAWSGAGAGGLASSFTADHSKAVAAQYDALKESLIGINSPMAQANDNLKNQGQLLDLQASSAGKSAAEIAGAAAKQEMWNKLISEGRVAEAQALGVLPQLTALVNSYGDATEANAKKQEGLTKQIGAMDAVRSEFSGFASALVSGFASGKKGADALRDAVKRLLDSLAQRSVSSLDQALFGQQGSLGGGVLGPALGSLMKSFGFGGVSATAASAPSITPGSLYASGGPVRGAGTWTSDSIPARLSDGEFVVRAASASRHLSMLHAINDNRLPAFASGGPVGPLPIFGAGAMAPSPAGGSAAPATIVSIKNYSGAPVSQQRGVGGNVDVIVHALTGKIVDSMARGQGPARAIGAVAGGQHLRG